MALYYCIGMEIAQVNEELTQVLKREPKVGGRVGLHLPQADPFILFKVRQSPSTC